MRTELTRHAPREIQTPPEGIPVCAAGASFAGGLAALDALEMESLMLNLDTSLKVHASHHFFNWTQGSLQSLVRHELLICVLGNCEPASFHVESFSSAALDLARFNGILRQDAGVVAQLVKAWEDNHRRPLIQDAAGEGALGSSTLARELNRIGASQLIAHGTCDASGRAASFFVFACRPGTAGSKQAYLAELLVPLLHSAWVRTQLNWSGASASVKPAATNLLTSREIEILKWLYHGKSNIEIGMILTISPLTAKNHVQKILRKLNVLNRTQAVGKALALRILNA
jgi:transcriptional regulator EpsA